MKSPKGKKKKESAPGGAKKKSTKSAELGMFQQLVRQSAKRQSLTSASSPGLSLKMTMASIAVMADLHEGIPVMKVSNDGDWHRRFLTLSQDQCTLFITHSRVDNELHVSRLPKPVWTPSKGWNASYHRYIDVADLIDVQVGVIGTQILETIKAKKRDEVKDMIVTIHHHEYLGRTSLNVIVENPRHRMALIGALATMKENFRDQEQWVGREILLMRYIWYDIDYDKNSMVSEKEFITLCQRINLFVPGIGKKYRDFLKENNIRGKAITYGESTKLIAILKGKQAVDDIWQKLFGSAVTITAKKFHEKFLKLAQGEKKATLQDAKDMIASINSVEMGEGSEPQHMYRLEKDRFEEFLRSPWNDAFDPKAQGLPAKGLNKPLSAYWISSSHNTYLTGDQLKSKSSVEAYTMALQRGCKCLELDVWDGYERRGDLIPVIYHGHTLTTKIELQMVLMVVNNHLAKHPDTYPIILSIENHCSMPYQEAMAKMIKYIFGVRLFIPTANQRTVMLPSPEELKGMVVIKGKRPPEPDEAEEEVKGKSKKRDTESFMEDMFNKFEPQQIPQAGKISTMVPQSFRVGSDSLHEQATGKKKGGKGGKDGVGNLNDSYCKELLEITYFHGAKFKYFEDSIEIMPSHMHSINESKIVALVTQYDNNPQLWRKYNTAHLTRTYPAGVRIDSSNYNPILAWAMGCQMVALNFQTPDQSMMLNDGRFRQFGNCGYVEKPESVLTSEPQIPKVVKIRILSGSCLPKPKGERTGEHIDPMIFVNLHDVKLTKRGKEQYYTEKHVTKRADNNGYAPVFADKGQGFTVHNPDVAMFVFQVRDADIGADDQIACAAIPISCLRKGFRSIQLYNMHNNRSGPFHCATLLVHIII